MYEDSINNPESFWAKQALLQVDWIKQPTEIISYDMSKGKVEWFNDGQLNASFNFALTDI